jgi:hypothetical protein
MSNTAIFAYIIMFIMISTGLLVLYGVTQPAFQNTVNAPYQCLVNSNPSASCAFPTWNPPTPSNVTTTLNQIPWWKCILSTPCVFAAVTGSIGGASTAQSIWNGFSIFGYGIGVFLQSVFVFFVKLEAGGLFLTGLITFLNDDSGVPFLGNIYLAFEIFLVIFGIALIKPGGSGQ